jgi:uridine kinase
MSTTSSFEQVTSYLDGKLKLNHDHVVIAIDGDAASGKTTLSLELAKHYHATVIHTDQFYLPFDKRTESPAGHMNIKKIIHEVLIPHALGKELHFEWFDPHQGKVREIIQLPHTQLLILEGSYSMHPDLLPYMHYKIFLSISESLQQKRILSRSNPETLEKFKSIWIPKEKLYQSAFSIPAFADIIIDADASSIKENL